MTGTVIMIHVLYDDSHIITTQWLTTSVEAGVVALLARLVCKGAVCFIGLIYSKLVEKQFGQSCGFSFGIKYNSIPFLYVKAVDVFISIDQFLNWSILTLY